MLYEKVHEYFKEFLVLRKVPCLQVVYEITWTYSSCPISFLARNAVCYP